jgi:kynurenine formamidase
MLKGSIKFRDNEYEVDYGKPMDVSIPLIPNNIGPNCFYAPPPEASPVQSGDFTGSVEAGSPVNFYNLKVNPHGNGTHTESYGHIDQSQYPIRKSLSNFVFPAYLVSVFPEKLDNGDRVITEDGIKNALEGVDLPPALIIRTLPNSEVKLAFNYSGTNPPYLSGEAISYIVERGIQHLLVDLPSVDKEEDGGKLAAHKSFWKYPASIRTEATISELLYIADEIKDGLYLLHLYVLNLDLDASPSRPVLYKLDVRK